MSIKYENKIFLKFFFIIIILTILIQIGLSNEAKNINNFKRIKKKNFEDNDEKIFYDEKTYFPKSLDTRSANDACHLNIECNNYESTHLKLPIHGPKGDQGPPGAAGPKGEKGEPGIAGIPAREPPTPNFSAFFAALVNNSGPYKQDKDLIFSHVITNYGNHYNPKTGVYTVPYNGVYQFHAIISATGRQKAGVNIMKNGVSLLTVWSESEPWSTSNQPIILECLQGDRIYLRIQSRASHLHGYLYSSFGGSLLYEEISPL
ncbi:unnamed protein product [Brachionus calyciflorus]|uniref:C1q domain-containing protein n=1 Tax=Brachionus calyciflorus TaxID=104777 RepID=A0A813MJZ0_9BILA|nr:unnamed protein product [Brachionus calyciflorus]